jgi:hypothetical protein
MHSRAVPSTVGLMLVCLASCRSGKPAATPPAPAAPVARVRTGPPPVALPAVVPTTSSTRATLKLDSTWHRCHASFALSGEPRDVRADVAKLASGCAEATKMHRLAEPFAGEQAAADKPQTFRWKAQASHCYRAYGVGGAGIKNLDLLMVDGNGIVLGQDGNDDAAPVLLDAGAVCFKQDDDAAVVVSVGDGKGAFAVEVWGD